MQSGTMKNRNSMDLIEAESVKKRWQEYMKNYTKKDLTDSDNHDGVWSQTSWSVKSSGP